MTNNQIIDLAITETLKEHPNFAGVYSTTIYENIIEEVNLRNFTSQNNARRNMSRMTSNDLLRYILDEAIIIYEALLRLYPQIETNQKLDINSQRNIRNCFPEWKTIQEEIIRLQLTRSNVFNVYRLDPNRLFALVNAVMKIRFNPNFYLYDKDSEKGFELYYSGQELRKKITRLGTEANRFATLQDKIEKDYQNIKNIKNVRVNHLAINRCLQEVLDGTQIKHQRNEYNLDGTLFATQDIGRYRQNQEDSTLIMNHPQNPNFKILVVADGMGGGEYGEKASNYIVSELSKWFSKLPLTYYENYEKLYPEFQSVVQRISQDIYEKYNKRSGRISVGSTLVGAIIGKDITTIINVGDSRAYAIQNGVINLVTEDESRVWDEMKYKVRSEQRSIRVSDINQLRFARANNEIKNAVGLGELPTPQIKLLYNKSYDKLLLFSDGVHDLLSMDDISVITKTTKPQDLTKAIVNMAISTPAYGYDEYGQAVKVGAGKDNATAAAYIRR